jgi:hypothetical protein
MRLPNSAHTSRPWRIRALTADFILEDVWTLPAQGEAEDFQTLIEIVTSSHPSGTSSRSTRLLWRLRDRLGGWLDLGTISAPTDGREDGATGSSPVPARHETSLADRLPDDLRGTAADLHFSSLPFTPLYRTEVEFAAELSNRTVHGVMHLAWVDQRGGRYRGQLAVYVKPRGRLGRWYMAIIKPFRYWIVYPALMRQIERAWDARMTCRSAASTSPAPVAR